MMGGRFDGNLQLGVIHIATFSFLCFNMYDKRSLHFFGLSSS